ncbi:MAG: hypothetical protein Q9221_003574, partial [Calogaya cf. arnoldii]
MSHPVPLDPRTDVTLEAKLNHLCEKCLNVAHQISLLQKAWSKDSGGQTVQLVDHHRSSSALITSAQSGCHLCTLLLEEIDGPILRELQTQEAENAIETELPSGTPLASYQIRLNGYFCRKKPPQLGRDIGVDVVLASKSTYETLTLFVHHAIGLSLISYGYDPMYRDRQNPSISTASPSAFALARSWLHECDEQHPGCRAQHRSVAGTALPTRLIDVGSIVDGPATCRLFLPEPPSERVEYVTLSHKWGGADILKLTQATIKSMLQRIDTEALPLTFQHAIFITRNLGYRYLWIDSLCIVQDGRDDWAFESLTMSRIYSNSAVTIAALWGENSHSGCFVERNPFVTELCRIGEWEHGELFIQSSRLRIRQYEYLDRVVPKPLLERGWVLQERFLSPRTLYYGPWQLMWEYGERSASEAKPRITSVYSTEATLKKRFRDMKRLPDLDLIIPYYMRELQSFYAMSELRSVYDIWTEIRNIYWSSQLTRHSDIIIAINGITTSMEQQTGVHFAFGLLKELILYELLWT